MGYNVSSESKAINGIVPIPLDEPERIISPNATFGIGGVRGWN